MRITRRGGGVGGEEDDGEMDFSGEDVAGD